MDTQATESSNTPLDVNQAANAFLEILDPKEPEENQEAETPVEETQQDEAEPETEESEVEQPETITIKVDGKDVEVTLDELKKGYQRQADYTRKTMEVSETRKAAEAEAAQLRAERQQYAQKLNEQQVVLQAVLQDQQNIDWQTLLDSDPMEYLKQRDLLERRQQAYQANIAEQQRLFQYQQAEHAQQLQQFIAQQQEAVINKLPDWKDEGKAKAEKLAIREFLKNEGFEDGEISNVTDHRTVILARKAMLYDQMIGKAKAAAKKVENLPQKVQRPGSGQNVSVDKRGQAFQRLQKSGKVEDAAAVFASIL